MENKGFGAGIIIAILVILIGIFWYSSTRKDTTPSETVATSTVPQTNTNTTIIPYGRVTLGLGDSASFRGITITPLAVVEDSRCPQDVQCIQAGTVRVNVNSEFDNGSTRQDIIKLGSSTTVDTFGINLVSVTPGAKKAGVKINSTDYEFTFEVRQSAVVDEELIGK